MKRRYHKSARCIYVGEGKIGPRPVPREIWDSVAIAPYRKLIRELCDLHGGFVWQLYDKSRCAKYVELRRKVWAALAARPKMTLYRLGQISGRHHATVFYGLRGGRGKIAQEHRVAA